MAAFHCCFSLEPDFQQDSLAALAELAGGCLLDSCCMWRANINFSIGKLTGRAELGYAAPAANPEKEDDSESPRSLPCFPTLHCHSLSLCPSPLSLWKLVWQCVQGGTTLHSRVVWCQQQNVFLSLGDHQHLSILPALAGSTRYMSHVLLPDCLVPLHLDLVHS